MAKRKLKSVSNAGRVATVYRDPEWNEYVVKLRGRPGADYFTSDRGDAEATAKKMVGLGRYGGTTEQHRERSRVTMHEIKRLRTQIRSAMRAPPDCVHAAHLIRSLAQQEGAFWVDRHESKGRVTGWTTSRYIVDRFIKACVVHPRSQAAARKMREVWR